MIVDHWGHKSIIQTWLMHYHWPMEIDICYLFYRTPPPQATKTFFFSLSLSLSLYITWGRKRSLENNNKRLTEKPFPELIPTQPDAKVRNPTRKCVVCNMNVGKRVTPGVNSKRKETRYWCANCEKPLCVVDCFKRYHTLVQYKLVQNNESDSDWSHLHWSYLFDWWHWTHLLFYIYRYNKQFFIIMMINDN